MPRVIAFLPPFLDFNAHKKQQKQRSVKSFNCARSRNARDQKRARLKTPALSVWLVRRVCVCVWEREESGVWVAWKGGGRVCIINALHRICIFLI